MLSFCWAIKPAIEDKGEINKDMTTADWTAPTKNAAILTLCLFLIFLGIKNLKRQW